MKYFSIRELTRSDTAATNGIDNTPPAAAVAALTALVDNVLDPLREAWGQAIYVSSGYRCPELNRAIGGVMTSQHVTGQAADITTRNVIDNYRLAALAANLGKFDQLIVENADYCLNRLGCQWVHISHSSTPRNEVLIKWNGSKTYNRWRFASKEGSV